MVHRNRNERHIIMVSVASTLYLTDNFDLSPYRVRVSDEGVTLKTSALEPLFGYQFTF